ncbi:MAG: 2,3-bisphosphoglycerate-independent phosphoglycerate mutase [Zoogloeaceae bacterium]|jgi:2,3-bisphosphoglycerate-independent phosphoglycerate mutase|nr:2,3-bisphosphoglycerate-independent phosphoglycerate mutase [Zoogloeaceae bacterium]
MLSKSPFPGVAGPVALIVLDGVGVSANSAALGNAVAAARKPTLDALFAEHPHILLKAHGTAVGMPSDADMGNSEVGHNAIGAGQIYAQGAALVATAIENGSLWQGSGWREIIAQIKANAASVLHLLGLFSDGNVHSHIDHLKAMLVQARAEGVRRVRIHVLLDGRDVPETSALAYIEPFEAFLAGIACEDFDARIASGGGRQVITMDRYEADWRMVEKGWHTHVLGEGEFFPDCATAIRTLRARHPGISDQDLPPFVIAEAGKPIGAIQDGDAVALFNFRGDRAIEISRAFEERHFDRFDRVRVPQVVYAGMLQYDGDLALPKRFLISPPAIRNTLSEWLSRSGITQFACSETQKFGHVTYFWNGNRSGKFPLETWQEIQSDRIPFEQRPWMKSAEIADAMIDAIKGGSYRFLRCNFANGDMVGHTGNFRAATLAVEAVDLALSRILPVVRDAGGAALITADHGNADEMFELDAQKTPLRNPDGSPRAKTAHTLNPVPLLLYEPGGQFALNALPDAGLAHLAASVTQLLGLERHASWQPGLLTRRQK